MNPWTLPPSLLCFTSSCFFPSPLLRFLHSSFFLPGHLLHHSTVFKTFNFKPASQSPGPRSAHGKEHLSPKHTFCSAVWGLVYHQLLIRPLSVLWKLRFSSLSLCRSLFFPFPLFLFTCWTLPYCSCNGESFENKLNTNNNHNVIQLIYNWKGRTWCND